MPDLGGADWAWLGGAALLAGLVRGFSGFGTALIFVPLAATVLPPIHVLIALTIMDVIGPLPNLPRALRDGRPRDVGVIGLFAGLALLPSLWVLTRMPADTFRIVAVAVCLTTVAVLISGWRWSGRMTRPVLAGTGLIAGTMGGLSGLPGPPVIALHMSAPLPASAIRANTLMFLVLWDVVFLAVLTVQGLLSWPPILIGAVLIPLALLANVLGARLFRPGYERVYRGLAYALVAGAAIAALLRG